MLPKIVSYHIESSDYSINGNLDEHAICFYFMEADEGKLEIYFLLSYDIKYILCQSSSPEIYN